MTHPADGKTLSEVTKLDGVSDIQPVMARGKFAQALMAEAKGDHSKAEAFLQDAVEKAS